mgnify:CR=1 FL=1
MRNVALAFALTLGLGSTVPAVAELPAGSGTAWEIVADLTTEIGQRLAGSPREAAAGQEFVMACVGNDDDLRGICLGPDGAFAVDLKDDEKAEEFLKVAILYGDEQWSARAQYEAGQCYEQRPLTVFAGSIDVKRVTSIDGESLTDLFDMGFV